MSYLEDVSRAMDLVAEASELLGPYLRVFARHTARSSVALREADEALEEAYLNLWDVIVTQEEPLRRWWAETKQGAARKPAPHPVERSPATPPTDPSHGQ